MLAEECDRSRELAHWKSIITRGWESIELVSINLMNTADNSLLLGDKFIAELVLDLNELNESDFGVEVVFIQKNLEGEESIISVYEMDQLKRENGKVTFRCEVTTKRVGIYNYAFRMFPKHELLAHRQDLKLVRWF